MRKIVTLPGKPDYLGEAPAAPAAVNAERPLQWQPPGGKIDPDEYWTPLPVWPTAEGANAYAIVGVSNTDWEQAARPGSWQAIAVRLGERSMVGSVEAVSSHGLLQSVDQNGQTSHYGDMMVVAVPAGEQEGLQVAIGTASPGGRYFWPLKTQFLGGAVELPSGLSVVQYPTLQ